MEKLKEKNYSENFVSVLVRYSGTSRIWAAFLFLFYLLFFFFLGGGGYYSYRNTLSCGTTKHIIGVCTVKKERTKVSEVVNLAEVSEWRMLEKLLFGDLIFHTLYPLNVHWLNYRNSQWMGEINVGQTYVSGAPQNRHPICGWLYWTHGGEWPVSVYLRTHVNLQASSDRSKRSNELHCISLAYCLNGKFLHGKFTEQKGACHGKSCHKHS